MHAQCPFSRWQLGLLLGLAAPLAAQDPYVRPKQQIDLTSTGIGLQPSVSSGEVLTAIVYFDGGSAGSDNVYSVIGPGNGTTWLAPERVDDDTTAASKLTQFDSAYVSGDVVYALWKDERNGSSNDDLYFARRPAGAGAFDANVQIDTGVATGTNGRVNAWRMAVSEDPVGDHIYILAQVDTPAESNDTLYLTASHDGGQTFGSGVLVPQTTSPFSVESIAIAAEGMTVHVSWADDRNDPEAGSSGTLDDVWYQRSTDGGQTFLSADVQLDSSGPQSGDSAATGTTGFRIDTVGNLVVAAWLEEITDPTDEEVRVAVSVDGGSTWAADVLVGGYDIAGGDDVDTMDMKLAANGNICVAYNDNRTGEGTLDRMYVSTSTDAGVSWSEVQVSGIDGGNDPRFAGSGAFIGLCFADDNGPNNAAMGADSSDSGVTWRTGIQLQDKTTDADSAVGGWNELYKNWTHAWLANDVSTNNVFVGGYRAQNVEPSVVGPDGSGNYTVDFELFDFPDSDSLGIVLIAATPGFFPLAAFGDARDLGLTADGLFDFSSGSALWLTSLSGGDGSAPTLVTDLIGPGFSFVATAFSFDFPSGVFTIGELSDVVPVVVP
ncbi:MAG: sialidase family protein [Planctomycetota bacterium]